MASHATSKIRDADDLFRVRTLGFRGEALASIAEVSQTRRSAAARRAAPGGARAGGRRAADAGEVAPCGCPVGTAIEVRNLFFNTPVRRKFLAHHADRDGPRQRGLHADRPGRTRPIHFTLRHNERRVYDLPAVGTAGGSGSRRSSASRSAESLIWVESERRRRAAVAATWPIPSHSRGNNRMQYLFLNGRHIRDRSLQHASGRGLSRTADDRPLSRSPFCGWRCRRSGRRERASRPSWRSASRTAADSTASCWARCGAGS